MHVCDVMYLLSPHFDCDHVFKKLRVPCFWSYSVKRVFAGFCPSWILCVMEFGGHYGAHEAETKVYNYNAFPDCMTI